MISIKRFIPHGDGDDATLSGDDCMGGSPLRNTTHGDGDDASTAANRTDANRTMQATPKRMHSLSFRMIWLLLLCWVLPVLLLILGGGTALRSQLITQSLDSMSLTVQSASQMSALRLDAAVSASRDASYAGTIKQAWSSYQSSGNKVALFDTTRTYLVQQYQTETLFRSTILLFTDFSSEPIYIINGAVGGTDRVRQDADTIFVNAQYIADSLDTNIGFFSVGERVFMVRNIVDSRYQTIALLLMELNTDLIFAEFGQLQNVTQSVTVLGDITMPSLQGAESDAAQLMADAATAEGSFAHYAEGNIFATVQVQGEDYSFAYYAKTTPTILDAQWNIVLILLSVILLLMLPMGALIYRFFAVQVRQPIRLMTKAAGAVRCEEYGTQLPLAQMHSREFSVLAEDFNAMSLTLQQQFDHIYKEEIALRDARIMALQSQINPHFLNNTLEIINWEARMQGNLNVCNMLESLSTMLNAAMDRSSNRFVHLSQELMYVDAYLYIINERLGKRLVFEKEIPEEYLDIQMPRLILQPILENAVEHGISPLQQGRIRLSAACEGDWLILSVENDGAMSPQDEETVLRLLQDVEEGKRMSSGSLGLRNVHQRLRILYGEEGGILVDTTKKDCTIFKLKVKYC